MARSLDLCYRTTVNWAFCLYSHILHPICFNNIFMHSDPSLRKLLLLRSYSKDNKHETGTCFKTTCTCKTCSISEKQKHQCIRLDYFTLENIKFDQGFDQALRCHHLKQLWTWFQARYKCQSIWNIKCVLCNSNSPFGVDLNEASMLYEADWATLPFPCSMPIRISWGSLITHVTRHRWAWTLKHSCKFRME